MTLTAAESRVLLAALLEFAASCESDFPTLREYHTFLEAEDEAVNAKELARKLGVETAGSRGTATLEAKPR
jgi:hypothetical protein